MTEKKSTPQVDALRVRERAKNKKPKFLRQESWRYDKLSESWRRPRGLDNKVRRKIKGWPASPNTGYKGPKAARGLHPSGYKEVMVHNVEEISKINKDLQAARIAHSVGKRKRTQIIAEGRKLNILILNARETKKEKEAEETEETAKETEEKPKEKSKKKEDKKEKSKKESKTKEGSKKQ